MALGYLHNGSAGPQQAEVLCSHWRILIPYNGAAVPQQAEVLAATRGYLFPAKIVVTRSVVKFNQVILLAESL